jgi:hypothetical protein
LSLPRRAITQIGYVTPVCVRSLHDHACLVAQLRVSEYTKSHEFSWKSGGGL